MNPIFWRERLERLRREQNPRQEDRPVLQLPLPEPPREAPKPPDDEDETPSRVIIIDL